VSAPSRADDTATLRRALRKAAPAMARDLPWIGAEPWPVLVSEFMLQQTQTVRVVEPWRRFLDAFPTPQDCANAPLADVLRLWAGLGFPRRAKYLHETAKAICERFAGLIPSTPAALRSLPGIGSYTANAVASFAFGAPTAVLDTNVGRVLARAVANRPLRPQEAQQLADAVVPPRESARFNQALLDLGAQFCTRQPQCEYCPVSKACRWHREAGEDPAPQSAGVSKPQSRFEGSMRQLRGRVLGMLHDGPVATPALLSAWPSDTHRMAECLAGLERDGLIVERGQQWCLVGESAN
jgi:A/G-specific adenine glycosylase